MTRTAMRDAHIQTHGNRPATVYRLYASDGSPLYFGCTCNFLTRMRDLSLRTWFYEVSRARLTSFSTRLRALEAECAAIAEEQPKYNIEGNRTPGDDGTGNWAWRRGLPVERPTPVPSYAEFREFLSALDMEEVEAA